MMLTDFFPPEEYHISHVICHTHNTDVAALHNTNCGTHPGDNSGTIFICICLIKGFADQFIGNQGCLLSIIHWILKIKHVILFPEIL